MRYIKTLFTTLMLGFSTLGYAAETNKFTLSTPIAFDQGSLPSTYTCDGEKISPKLIWLGAPANTQTFALIIADPDAPDGMFYHWVLYNIPKDVSHLDKGITTLPAGTVVGLNSTNQANYFSPCPPKGQRHHYIFTVYALDSELHLTPGASAELVETAMKGHVIQEAKMTVLYGR